MFLMVVMLLHYKHYEVKTRSEIISNKRILLTYTLLYMSMFSFHFLVGVQLGSHWDIVAMRLALVGLGLCSTVLSAPTRRAIMRNDAHC